MALDIAEPPACRHRHRHRRLRSGSGSIRRLRNLLASDVGGQTQDPPPHRLRSRCYRLLDDCLWPHHRPSSSPYFSTLERLRLVDGSGLSQHKRSASLPTSSLEHRVQSAAAPALKPSAAPRSGLGSRFNFGRDEPTRRRVVLEAADETCRKTGKRHFQAVTPSRPQLDRPVVVDMQSAADQKPGLAGTAESMYDSFRWLEEDDDLDLRLFLDDYHLNLREEVLAPTKSQSGRPSFRRHLSISKLPFGGRVSGTFSRPSTKDEGSPTSPTSPVFGNSGGHVRRRSRALSLMAPRQASPEFPTTIDPGASHYQDPEARMKLRVYLASPHKFDEAIEFGFPSIEEVHDQEPQEEESCKEERTTSRVESPRPQTFLEDDASSVYSEESMADPESPKTPGAADKPLPMRPVRVSQDTGSGSKLDYASSREMTLRMTLTRPDLRSHEEQMYGWQKSSTGRRSHTRDEPLPKGSIEQQLAAIDQEELAGDGSAVKRFWNRVRRN
ncbi:hypothetical protein CP532_6887 [Ophiocordyceps camponoti-leonardi (nom. inval.)]|nr:hypothetical protein CP532_6887 [Ophiocordyceps camponoti-leonardi (nom. inval.)]